jgi:hypothetical protein
MPEQPILDASKSIIDVGVIGAVLILVLAAFAWTVRTWRADIEKLQGQLAAERAAHQQTKNDQISDLRNLARVAESVDEMRRTLMDLAVKGERA